MNIQNVKIVHFHPGRVRLRVKELRSAEALAREVEQTLGSVPGVTHVEASSLTGSILVEYDQSAIKSEQSIHALSDVLGKLFPTLDVPQLLAWLAHTGH
jgi:copper chaperone CopZ